MLKVTISDAHVGLDPDPNGDGLFKYKYDAVEFHKSLDKVFESIKKEFENNGKFETLMLQDLGDALDGWD